MASVFTVGAAVTLPLVTISSPSPSTLLIATTVSVTGTINDPAANVVVNGVTASKNGGTYTASNVPLTEGANVITATATNSSGVASSASITVVVDTTPPIVVIDSPTANAVLSSSTVTVTGMINDIVTGTVNAPQATVTVNGIPATISNRTFIVPDLLLVSGVNTITAVARDHAGNQAQTQIQVTYTK